jgi:hypothetical protein
VRTAFATSALSHFAIFAPTLAWEFAVRSREQLFSLQLSPIKKTNLLQLAFSEEALRGQLAFLKETLRDQLSYFERSLTGLAFLFLKETLRDQLSYFERSLTGLAFLFLKETLRDQLSYFQRGLTGPAFIFFLLIETLRDQLFNNHVTNVYRDLCVRKDGGQPMC